MRVCHQCGASCNAQDRFCAACGTTLAEESSSGVTDPLVGRTVGGAYTLQEIVGVGGMGRVYRAEQQVLGRTVAVKVIHPHLLGDQQTVARFYAEARTASRLNHPNSVGIIDFGRTDDGILYLVMEFLQGKDLAFVMHEEGPLPLRRVCEMIIATLDALAEAHHLGVVHRDLKPENIIVKKLRSGGDLVKVVDFGLATILGGGESSITRPGLVCGTPDYMAPEQARGEQVDGRTDLYSLGVALFELITEQLPYRDETPTKVVLRHLNDPIPDPRECAPHRNIPKALADLTVRALDKDPAKRFQSAEEMQEALRAVLASLRAGRQQAPCSICGTANPPKMRFCGQCGNPLSGMHVVSTLPPRRAAQPSFVPVGAGTDRPFVGRLTELVELDTVRGSAKDGFRWIRIIGESGSGKTRLLAELAERYRARGDAVAGAGPHRSGAPVPYAAWRRIFSELLHVSADALEGQMDALTKSDGPLARAGLEEVLGAAGLRGMDGADRSGAVAAAFAAIVRRAVQVAPSHQVAVFLDDIGRCDGLSQKVLRHLPELLGEASLLLVTTDVIKGGVVPGSETIELKGLTGDEIAEFTGAPAGSGTAAAPPGLGRRRLLPLYLEQLQRLTRDGAADEALPPRLADAVGQRVDALPMAARLTLQAASVLGDRCQLEELMRVAQLETTEAITVLSREGLLRMSGDCLEVAHPFLRDLVEASIPAEARRELHQRALELFSSRGAPLEVRAEHAYRAGEPMSALMLLERMGDTAIERGDGGTAVLAFRRALELARREMLESGDAAMDTALVTFSRKLGVALAGSGDVGGADGVLREALDLTGPKSPDRSRLLLELAKVAAQRGRRRDAMRMLGQALERVADGHDPASEARVQICLGKVRRDEGEVVGAANAYRQAVELLDEVDAPQLERARTRLELGRVLLEQGHSERAIPILEEASRLAAEAEGLALQAAILGALGTIAHQAADLATAQIRYGEAARLAAEAGDAEGARLWEEAGAS